MSVLNILKILEVKFKGINVLENNELRQGIKEYSEWPTIPQLYFPFGLSTLSKTTASSAALCSIEILRFLLACYENY